MSNVRLIAITKVVANDLPAELQGPEGLMAYAARVSNPEGQGNPNYAGLLKYCVTHGHWSVFETASMTLEIETTRAIAQQVLRHRSFSFQEFSQRYAKSTSFEIVEARRQDLKNRQNSIDDLTEETKNWFTAAQKQVIKLSSELYEVALGFGIAKEQARFLLPLNTATRLYMTGNVRSWIHWIQVRGDVSTQSEHRVLALKTKEIFKDSFPTVAKALGWSDESDTNVQPI